MKDYFGKEVNAGDVVFYTAKSGASMTSKVYVVERLVPTTRTEWKYDPATKRDVRSTVPHEKVYLTGFKKSWGTWDSKTQTLINKGVVKKYTRQIFSPKDMVKIETPLNLEDPIQAAVGVYAISKLKK